MDYDPIGTLEAEHARHVAERETHPPKCPHCQAQPSMLSPLTGGWWLCECCAKTFQAEAEA